MKRFGQKVYDVGGRGTKGIDAPFSIKLVPPFNMRSVLFGGAWFPGSKQDVRARCRNPSFSQGLPDSRQAMSLVCRMTGCDPARDGCISTSALLGMSLG